MKTPYRSEKTGMLVGVDDVRVGTAFQQRLNTFYVVSGNGKHQCSPVLAKIIKNKLFSSLNQMIRSDFCGENIYLPV